MYKSNPELFSTMLLNLKVIFLENILDPFTISFKDISAPIMVNNETTLPFTVLFITILVLFIPKPLIGTGYEKSIRQPSPQILTLFPVSEPTRTVLSYFWSQN